MIAHKLNEAGQVKEAYTVTDFCNAMCDCAKAIDKNIELGIEAVVQGGIEGAAETIQDIKQHPVSYTVIKVKLFKDTEKMTGQIAKRIRAEFKEFQELNKAIEALFPKTSFHKYGLFETRVKHANDYVKQLERTEKFYEVMRQSNLDVKQISKNVGLSENIIKKI